ncbi:GIP [Symbiodinium sp. CCMP2592]|nr:GIP [Symbiodinium sp. CCMP2592]
MAADSANNPNLHDEPVRQQVMIRPSATASATATQNDNECGRPLMNGIQNPLRGSQDIDDEVVAATAGTTPMTGREAPSAVGDAAPGTGRTQVASAFGGLSGADSQRNPVADLRAPASGLSAALPGPRSPAAPSQDGPRPSAPPGVLTGVLRAVQTLPATMENLVARSTGGRSGPGTPAQHDSVEYASVRSSAERGLPPPPPEPTPSDPLFDVPTLVRMQQMQEAAPLLYPAASLEFAGPCMSAEPVDQRGFYEREGMKSLHNRHMRSALDRACVATAGLEAPPIAQAPEAAPSQGVVSLPELPPHGPESCLSFADWLHASKPALADISDTSESLWTTTIAEAKEWYANYLIETMIIAASPQAIKDELSASRVRALSKLTKTVLQQNPEVAFRVNLARASLQIDLNPDDEKAGTKLDEAKGKGKGAKGDTNQQQIKSLLADAAWILQQSMPTSQSAGAEPAPTAAAVQGTPVTLASLSAQLDQRVDHFRQRVQNLECQLSAFDQCPDPTGALRSLVDTGTRVDALRAFLAQPYLEALPDEDPLEAATIETGKEVGGPGNVVEFSQGALGDEYLRPTALITNLDLSYLSFLISSHLNGQSACCEPPTTDAPSVEVEPLEMDWEGQALRRAFEVESDLDCDDEEEVLGEDLCVKEVEAPSRAPADGEDPKLNPKELGITGAELEGWKQHLRNGHLPYLWDCRQCVEGSGLGVFHKRVRFPKSFALSVDLFGPVPVSEAGRDEGCVTSKSILRYGLVGAFRVPRSVVQSTSGPSGVEDLFKGEVPQAPLEGDELAEYEPSNASDELFPELFASNPDAIQQTPEEREPVPDAEVKSAEAPEVSVWDSGDLPEDPVELAGLIKELNEPVDQVVLRYFIPLRTKSGVEVAEALQRMILGINQRFPVQSIHHDPGTEFGSAALSKWLANHGVRVQHSLPTDKRANGLAERTVGWVKSRIRTLLNGAGLSVGWWPLAARWAVAKHNQHLLGEADLPAFGQRVLHRVKQPADGTKQLMERWIEAQYAAPHRSITDGHVLINAAGNLEEDAGEPVDALVDESGEVAHELLISQDLSLKGVHKVLSAFAQEEESTGDRRGIAEGKYVLGAYCHGGLRGVTGLTKRKPWTTRLLNAVLASRVSACEGVRPTWSALMLMRAGDVEVHRDWRNEWGTLNFVMHVPGEVQLWVEPDETRALTEVPVAFNARRHHAVRMHQNWLIVGYTPLGTGKLQQSSVAMLEAYEFPMPETTSAQQHVPGVDDRGYRVQALTTSSEDTSESSIESGELQRQIEATRLREQVPDSDGGSCSSAAQDSLSADLQPSADSLLIGWDFSSGNPGDRPQEALENIDLADYLTVRGAHQAYRQLRALGIEVPNDLQFLFVEDLIEHGIPEWLATRIMQGIHPPGTRRPDNPQNSSLTTGEVRVFDKTNRQIPWIFQNRTLGVRCPGPPLPSLGIKQPDALRRLSDPKEDTRPGRRWDVPEETPRADPTDSPSPQLGLGPPYDNSGEPSSNPGVQVRSDYNHVMYMQEMWGDEEWIPSVGAASSSQPSRPVPSGAQLPSPDLGDNVVPEETSADPTDSSSPQSSEEYRCMVVRPCLSPSEARSGPESPSESLKARHQGAQGTRSVIGVPTEDPLGNIGAGHPAALPDPMINRVDESGFTPNVEDLLSKLQGPLEVTHNVAPAEVRQNLAAWRPAAQAELSTFETMGVIRKFYGSEARAILRSSDYEVIPGKPVCTVKPGAPYKRKFRIVSCGNYAKTTAESQLYAGGAGAESLRALLAHSARRGRRAYGLDVKSAFLLASIPEGVTKRYAMRAPRLLVELELAREDEVWIIDRALYGFRESPRWWSLFRDSFLAKAEWNTPLGKVTLEQFSSESNVWRMRHESGLCIGHLLVYVDDMLLLTEPEVAQSFIDWIRESWECTGLKEATATDPLRFLGVDIYAELNDTGDLIGYSLAQESYIAELLRSHDVRSNSRATAPVPKEWVRELPQEEEFSEKELRAAQRITGELLWVAQRSRVDISYCVGMMASWVARFPKQVLKIGLRTLEYLATTKSHRLMLIPGKADGLRIYTDASFAPHGSHSISGIALLYDECCIVWKSKRQSIVTLSTAESELVSGCEGVVLAQSLEALISELEEGPCGKHLMIDNTAAVTLAGGEGSQRTRHLRVRSSFIRDMIERREIEVSHCPGDVQLADCLTKALMKTRLDDLCKLLGLGPPNPNSTPSQVSRVETDALPSQGPFEPFSEASGQFSSRSAVQRSFVGNHRMGLWLLGMLLLVQADVNEAAPSDEFEAEPLGLELSLLVVLLVMSILFLWESGRYCVRSCCRQREPVAVRMVHADPDVGEQEPSTGRERRQEQVRRVIARELEEEGLRQRGIGSREVESRQPPHAEASYVRVEVETRPQLPALDLPPPPPPLPSSSSVSIPTDTTYGFHGLSGFPAVEPPPAPFPAFLETRSSVPNSGLEKEVKTAKDASTQTTFDQGFTFSELCELHVMTTASRSPGALHLFRSCQALRNTTSVQDRMICRYCLQALRDGRD